MTIEPGATLDYCAAEWRDAIVVIERGEVQLESESGVRCTFSSGDVVWLVGLPLRALHNPSTAPAVLVAVSRATPAAPDLRPQPP